MRLNYSRMMPLASGTVVPADFRAVADAPVTIEVTGPDGLVYSLGKGLAFKARLEPGSTVKVVGPGKVIYEPALAMSVRYDDAERPPSFVNLDRSQAKQSDAVVARFAQLLRANQRLAEKLRHQERQARGREAQLRLAASAEADAVAQAALVASADAEAAAAADAAQKAEQAAANAG